MQDTEGNETEKMVREGWHSQEGMPNVACKCASGRIGGALWCLCLVVCLLEGARNLTCGPASGDTGQHPQKRELYYDFDIL
jgi:hypothetical protein